MISLDKILKMAVSDSSCQNHQVDIDALTSDETDEIPLSVWNIIPKSSAYIKYVLEVGAYTAFESFASINTLEDITSAFNWMKQ